MRNKKKPLWGNSILWINYTHRLCDYCGEVIEDEKWFEIRRFNGYIYSLCKPICLEGMTVKHEAAHGK